MKNTYLRESIVILYCLCNVGDSKRESAQREKGG